VAAVRQLASGGYLVQLSEPELALIKTALEQTERGSRCPIEGLDRPGQATDGRRTENTRLRREIEALAMRKASLRVLQEAMAKLQPGEEVAQPRCNQPAMPPLASRAMHLVDASAIAPG
jgi:hypothetical protein